MSRIIEEMRNEAAQQAALENYRAIARNLIEIGKLSVEEVAKVTHLPVEEVRLIAENRSA